MTTVAIWVVQLVQTEAAEQPMGTFGIDAPRVLSSMLLQFQSHPSGVVSRMSGVYIDGTSVEMWNAPFGFTKGALGSVAESRQSALFATVPGGQVHARVGTLNMSPNESLSLSGKQLTPPPLQQTPPTHDKLVHSALTPQPWPRGRPSHSWVVVLQIGVFEGQSAAVQQLPTAVETQRVPHALNCGKLHV